MNDNIKLPNIWNKWNPEICDRDIYLNFDRSKNPFGSTIISRIGSASADAEVYHIRFDGVDFALKIMPRIDDDSEQKNINEINIAKHADDMPRHFPMVFGHGTTNRFTSNDSPLFKKAEEYHCYTTLSEQLSTKRQKLEFIHSYKEGTTLTDLIERFDLNPCVPKTITADYLISELANGDMGTWMNGDHLITDWKIILFDVISGIYYMSTTLKKAHSDLHPGNILIIEKTPKCDITALIHDFGRAIEVIDSIPITYITGLISFCTEFLGASKRTDLIVPSIIKQAIRQIYDSISSIDNNTLDINNIDNIYKKALMIIKGIPTKRKFHCKGRTMSKGRKGIRKSRRSRRKTRSSHKHA